MLRYGSGLSLGFCGLGNEFKFETERLSWGLGFCIVCILFFNTMLHTHACVCMYVCIYIYIYANIYIYRERERDMSVHMNAISTYA